MSQRHPSTAVIRDFGHWLQQWADFTLAQAEFAEGTGGAEREGQGTVSELDGAQSIDAGIAGIYAGPPTLPFGQVPGETVPSLEEAPSEMPPAEWQEVASTAGPPAHWLALFEQNDLEDADRVGTEGEVGDVGGGIALDDLLNSAMATAGAPIDDSDPERAQPENVPPENPLLAWVQQIHQGAASFLQAPHAALESDEQPALLHPESEPEEAVLTEPDVVRPAMTPQADTPTALPQSAFSEDGAALADAPEITVQERLASNARLQNGPAQNDLVTSAQSQPAKSISKLDSAGEPATVLEPAADVTNRHDELTAPAELRATAAHSPVAHSTAAQLSEDETSVAQPQIAPDVLSAQTRK